MNYKHFFIITGVICMFWTNSVTAQQMIKWRGSDGWGLASRYEEHFNKWNLETISGPISVIDTVTPLVDMAYGVQLIVKSRHEEVSVHLGPAWFILFQDMNLSVNDKVDVKGCRTSINGKTVIMATEVKRKDRILYLRDDDGYPYWTVWRKK